jgi:hypothetical protein
MAGHGTLPRDEGLLYVDMWHVTIPEIFTSCRNTLGGVHAATGFKKSVRLKRKSQAPEGMELILAFFNSAGRTITWIHVDNAPELIGSGMVPLARSKNIRITTTVPGKSRTNLRESPWRVDALGARKNLTQGKCPYELYGKAWDSAEEASNLTPSRDAPHDCALGRLLSTADKPYLPTSSHLRPAPAHWYPRQQDGYSSSSCTHDGLLWRAMR